MSKGLPPDAIFSNFGRSFSILSRGTDYSRHNASKSNMKYRENNRESPASASIGAPQTGFEPLRQHQPGGGIGCLKRRSPMAWDQLLG